MTVCHGCGGVVGRDCFNPQECEQITRSMADQFPQASQDVAELLAECDKLKAEVERLRKAMTLAECQYLGCGGRNTPSEIVESMRKTLQDALG